MNEQLNNPEVKNSKNSWLPILGLILVLSIGVNLWLWLRPATKHEDNVAGVAEVYVCPMHPQVTSDHAIDCPICGMKLVKKSSVATGENSGTVAEAVHLSPSQEVLANVKTEKPELLPFQAATRVTGKIAAKQESQWKFSLRTMGRIDSIFITEPGTVVKPGDRLVTVYSPELSSIESEFLSAVSGKNSATVIASAEAKLLAMGLDADQIDELKSSGKPHTRFTFRAKQRGVLMERMGKIGEWTMSNMTLLDFIDLETVWVEAAFLERDAFAVKRGDKLAVRYDTESSTAIVQSIGVELDMMSRTLPVRAELRNSDLKWKPGMSVEVEWKSGKTQEYLSVPEEAVLQTGARDRVWCKSSDGKFVPKIVVTGSRADGRVAIISGIGTDDEIAVTGAYLIDAESQMKNIGSAVLQSPPSTVSSTAKTSDQKSEKTPAKTTQKEAAKPAKEIYTCPMDPEIVSDHPGKCPKCGMNLELKE